VSPRRHKRTATGNIDARTTHGTKNIGGISVCAREKIVWRKSRRSTAVSVPAPSKQNFWILNFKSSNRNATAPKIFRQTVPWPSLLRNSNHRAENFVTHDGFTIRVTQAQSRVSFYVVVGEIPPPPFADVFMESFSTASSGLRLSRMLRGIGGQKYINGTSRTLLNIGFADSSRQLK